MTPHVVIIGGGFGGLNAALSLARRNVRVTLVDRRNVHLFQPLLYQVATGGLSPGDITSPLRRILRRHRNVRVWLTDATGFDLDNHLVQLRDGSTHYDFLVVAPGVRNHYFGHHDWARVAPSLKTVEDAIEIRRRVLLAFERAELAETDDERKAWLTFAVIGAGPTGVELAGAMSELGRDTLRRDFRAIDTRASRIVLVEGADRTLPPFPAKLSTQCQRQLERLGVEVRLESRVTAIDGDGVSIETADGSSRLAARTVLWAAGVTAESLGQVLADAASCPTDGQGRLMVNEDLSVAGYHNVFVIGDLAHFDHGLPSPLPGIAPVAMQQGRYVAQHIVADIRGAASGPFRYRNKGQLATIGRAAAVADLGPRLRFSGYPAWILWLFVHLMYLVEFQNRVMVLLQWAWHYITWNRGARIITVPPSDPSREPDP